MKPSCISQQRPDDQAHTEETRREFLEVIRAAMHRIAVDVYNQRVQPQHYVETLSRAHEKYFNGMKGAVNIHLRDVHDLVDAETRRQEALYASIEQLTPHFDKVKPLDPTSLVSYSYWDHGPSHGCNVEINGTRFYASPLVPCSTDEYITVKQAPVPARILLINHHMILMLPYEEDASEETWAQLIKLIGPSTTVKEEAVAAPVHLENNYLWVHSEEKIDERLIKRLIRKHRVDAFMVGYLARNIAVIHTGVEEETETLWRTIYFEWMGMWRRYGWYE